ncbi:molecular chaperone DnaK [Oleiphilus sp. HI0009]|nr:MULTISPECIES: TraR/DksA C4-type zinc finger protein [unclassified Oleiphilus]KZX75696.1 molecular chaperone DnaK [Oleiphilus sp. HI0009]MCH2157415.1 TraR/DksA C4-type zinc finger protein [Oleiphilaceae bacterium]KZY63090.1 molecular chaperone DnaK [Oleiphilus sp. HI0066]KZY69699.1 molecular chaperone DnaK [Oleiphilus sp. HI0067]KZY75711.1 molecular chaperone DnaK [Oleiphilus sp. HI0067]
MSKSKKASEQYTIETIKLASEDEYMNDAQLAFFKALLIELHDSTRERIQEAKDQMSSPVDSADEGDRASWEEQCAISMRIVDREQKLLPKIQQSLERIRLGEYGYCIESGDPIGIPRLLLRPTAEYCADVKQAREMQEHVFRD